MAGFSVLYTSDTLNNYGLFVVLELEYDIRECVIIIIIINIREIIKLLHFTLCCITSVCPTELNH